MCLQVGNDGFVLIGDGYYGFNTDIPFISVYPVDQTTKDLKGSVFIQTRVFGDARMNIIEDINKYLFFQGRPTNFISDFNFLVTYNNTKKYGSQNRFTYQVAIASDGVQSFAVLTYVSLSADSTREIGYVNQRCKSRGRVYVSKRPGTKHLDEVSNIGVKGRHVIPLKC